MNDTLYSRLTAVVDDLLDSGITKRQAEDDFEQKLINEALVKCHGNQTKAAQLLGIHRNTLASRRRILKCDAIVRGRKDRKRRR